MYELCFSRVSKLRTWAPNDEPRQRGSLIIALCVLLAFHTRLSLYTNYYIHSPVILWNEIYSINVESDMML